jgi:hypothetical protein
LSGLGYMGNRYILARGGCIRDTLMDVFRP